MSRLPDERDDSQVDQRRRTPSDQDHSERRIWWTIFAVCVAAFIGILVLGRPLVEGRLSAARNLDEAVMLIAGTKEPLAQIDEAVRRAAMASRPPSSAPDAAALASVSATRANLEKAETLSTTGYDRLTEDEQERATLIEATATARLAVLAAAEAILSADGTASGNRCATTNKQ